MTKFTVVSQDAKAIYNAYSEVGGPEYNLAGDYSRRITWATDNPAEPFLSFTTTCYVNADVVDANGTVIREAIYNADDLALPFYYQMDRIELEDGEEMPTEFLRPYGMEHNEWIAHRTVDDLGDEIRSDYTTETFGYTFPNDIMDAEAECQKYVNSYNFERDLSPEAF